MGQAKSLYMLPHGSMSVPPSAPAVLPMHHLQHSDGSLQPMSYTM
jgi:hypothetical protein